jgi:hypothetical protein
LTAHFFPVFSETLSINDLPSSKYTAHQPAPSIRSLSQISSLDNPRDD